MYKNKQKSIDCT